MNLFEVLGELEPTMLLSDGGITDTVENLRDSIDEDDTTEYAPGSFDDGRTIIERLNKDGYRMSLVAYVQVFEQPMPTAAEREAALNDAGRRAAAGAIRDGWGAVTMDVPDGTIITSFLCAGFRRVRPDRYIVDRNPDGTVGLFTQREHDYLKMGIIDSSRRNLDPAKLDQYAIDPGTPPR